MMAIGAIFFFNIIFAIIIYKYEILHKLLSEGIIFDVKISIIML